MWNCSVCVLEFGRKQWEFYSSRTRDYTYDIDTKFLFGALH